jgi:hypothetical protein
VTILFVAFLFIMLWNRCDLTEDNTDPEPEEITYPRINLITVAGDLRLTERPAEDTYIVYFHIPIAFEDQAPVFLKINGDGLLNYRFVRFAPPNLIAAATVQHDATTLNWEGYVLVRELMDPSSGLPSSVPFPSQDQIPGDIRRWLRSTSCVQVDAPLVQETAAGVRDGTSDIQGLSRAIAAYCRNNIPFNFNHTPMGFSAVYALKWGNSCTGHAHAGAALFRANGIPARILLNFIPGYSGNLDMHWVIDYHITGHRWIKMETTANQIYLPSRKCVVVMVCEPAYENPLFYPNGIDSYWFSSSPDAGIPGWGQAHHSRDDPAGYTLGENDINQLFSITLAVWNRYVDTRGIVMDNAGRNHLENAYAAMEAAWSALTAENTTGGREALYNARDHLEQIPLSPVKNIYFNDFEKNADGWTHGGTEDEWEWGEPAYASDNTFGSYSGEKCWGTDLDGHYQNNADNWLLSPEINLHGLSCAYLSVYIRNSLDGDDLHYQYDDPLWMEISTGSGRFEPICSHMGGRNDDPEIYDMGGWGFLALDLTRYVGRKVQVRFRMTSNNQDTREGVHIDDFRVFGRENPAGE